MLTRPAGHEAEAEARKREDEAEAQIFFWGWAEATMYEAEAEARHVREQLSVYEREDWNGQKVTESRAHVTSRPWYWRSEHSFQ